MTLTTAGESSTSAWMENRAGFPCEQARDALAIEGERLQRFAAIRRIKRRFQCRADRHPRQELERIQEVALTRPIRSEQDDERLKFHPNIKQRFIALDFNAFEHCRTPFRCFPGRPRSQDPCVMGT